MSLLQISGALSICVEKPVVPVGNQMERAEIFRKKRNTFRGIPLFSFLPKILTGFSKQMESAPGLSDIFTALARALPSQLLSMSTLRNLLTLEHAGEPDALYPIWKVSIEALASRNKSRAVHI